MNTRLPAVLSSLDLPAVELRAAQLDGEVFAIGDGFAPLDEVEQPAHRANVLGLNSHPRLIAEQSTASWIWGASATLAHPLQFCVTMGARVGHHVEKTTVVREVVIEAAEIVAFDTLRVTTPLRTCLDLARFSSAWGSAEITAVRALAALGGFDRHELCEQLTVRRNLPGKRRAIQRLSA